MHICSHDFSCPSALCYYVRRLLTQAVALECMRGAHRQQRACYLYAFSGPRDVKELELKVSIQFNRTLLRCLMTNRLVLLHSVVCGRLWAT